MLESMTAMQYREWLAFFKIRDSKDKPAGQGNAQQGYGISPEGQKRMSGDILRAMTGYQKRRDRLKGQ